MNNTQKIERIFKKINEFKNEYFSKFDVPDVLFVVDDGVLYQGIFDYFHIDDDYLVNMNNKWEFDGTPKKKDIEKYEKYLSKLKKQVEDYPVYVRYVYTPNYATHKVGSVIKLDKLNKGEVYSSMEFLMNDYSINISKK